jgi:chromosome segregation ATPase
MNPSIIYAPIDSRQFIVHVQDSPVAHEELQQYREREERSRADFAMWKTERARFGNQLSILRREGAEKDRAMDRSTASVEKASAERDACSKESRKLQVEAIKNHKAIAALEADLKSANEGWSYYYEKWVELHSESVLHEER